MLTRIRNEERGMALIVSMMVVFVVLLLGTVVIAQSISNQDQSSYNRKRLQSVAAAEAGIDWFYNYVSHTKATDLACTDQNQQVADAPGGAATFTATPTYYNASGATMTCPFTSSSYPKSMLVTSKGKVAGQAGRTMQTYMQLTPTFGGFDAAIVTNGTNGLTLSNNLTLNGNGSNNADIYVNNGPLVITNSPTINGNIYVGGGCATPSTCTSSMTNNNRIAGNLWSAGTATINNPAQVTGDVKSSVGNISGNGTIGGSATAAGTISAGLSITGTRSPNTSSPLPPTQPFPQITWNASNWQTPPDGSPGYTVVEFNDPNACTNAKTYILNSANLTTNKVIHINSVCALSFTNNTDISFAGNLSIFTLGSVTMSNSVSWTGTGGQRKLFFISEWRNLTSAQCATGSYNVGDSNNVSYVSTDVFFYSPCTVSISNRSNMSGQVFGTTVAINNQFTMDFRPVLVPGVGTITGFNQDIVYIREVQS